VTEAVAQTRRALSEAAEELRAAWSIPATLGAALVVFALVVPPLVFDPLDLQDLAGWLYLALAGTGLAFALGLGGMPSLCQGAFMAIGAFTAALLRARIGAGPFEAALAGLALTTLAGVGLGLGFVRLGRVPFAVATWLFAWLVALGLAAFPAISGGADGIAIPNPGFGETGHYILALTLVVLACLALWAVARGAPGLALSALRQRPAAALALGVRATRLRLGAFVVSAALGGLAGSLGVQLQGIASAGGYDPFLSFKLLAAVVIGGMTSALGAVAGLAALSGLTQLSHWIGSLEQLSAARFDPMLFAILVLVVLGVGGAGIVPWLRRLLPRTSRSSASTPAAPALSARRPSATLAAQGLRKRFGGVIALDGLELEADTGAIVALIGPNGSGKTTALRVLSGTLTPDEGRLTLDGHRLNGGGIASRVDLGIVRTLQRTAIFDEMTALENVLAGAGVRRRYGSAVRTVLATPKSRAEDRMLREAALRTLDAVGLQPKAGTQAAALTASEQRRLMLASALATNPRVLLLDEIAAGGTAEDVRQLATILRALRDDGLAIVLVEHNLRLVRDVASTVVVLAGGRPIAAGKPTEVAALPEVQAAYLGTHRL
jgi:branched-chain amino acid transport system ATP-binding protein/branched-chain amino acid transport system permease protein